MKSIESTIRQKRRRERNAWRDGLFFALIALVLFFQFGLFRRMDKTHAEESQTDDAPAMTAESATESSGAVGATEAPTEQTEAPLPSYPTLYDWAKDNPPSIKVFIVEQPPLSVATDAAPTTATTTPVSPQVTEITPVLSNLFIVKLTKTDLDSGSAKKNIQVEITVALPERKVDKIGCLVISYGAESKENCEFDYEKPIIIDISEISFATLDDGTFSCPGYGSFGRPFYKDVKSYNINVNWVTDSGGNQIPFSPPITIELTSNLIMLSENIRSTDFKIGGYSASPCEAVLVIEPLPEDKSKVMVYSFRTKREDQIKIDFLVQTKYLDWLKNPSP